MANTTSRQVARKDLFNSHFKRHQGGAVPKDLPTRRERRNLARAYSTGAWRAESVRRKATAQ